MTDITESVFGQVSQFLFQEMTEHMSWHDKLALSATCKQLRNFVKDDIKTHQKILGKKNKPCIIEQGTGTDIKFYMLQTVQYITGEINCILKRVTPMAHNMTECCQQLGIDSQKVVSCHYSRRSCEQWNVDIID